MSGCKKVERIEIFHFRKVDNLSHSWFLTKSGFRIGCIDDQDAKEERRKVSIKNCHLRAKRKSKFFEGRERKGLLQQRWMNE